MLLKRRSFIVAVFVAGILGGVTMNIRAAEDKPPESTIQTMRFFELRTYTAAEGKLEALHARFRDHTNALFVKHGITLIGFWTPADEPRSKNTLIYILAYPDRESREKSWKEFQDDPDWKAAKAESEKNGKLVDHVDSVFMNPTDYSPIK
jgi:hypothetical protein